MRLARVDLPASGSPASTTNMPRGSIPVHSHSTARIRIELAVRAPQSGGAGGSRYARSLADMTAAPRFGSGSRFAVGSRAVDQLANLGSEPAR